MFVKCSLSLIITVHFEHIKLDDNYFSMLQLFSVWVVYWMWPTNEFSSISNALLSWWIFFLINLNKK